VVGGETPLGPALFSFSQGGRADLSEALPLRYNKRLLKAGGNS
jgi:hypothetical protein